MKQLSDLGEFYLLFGMSESLFCTLAGLRVTLSNLLLFTFWREGSTEFGKLQELSNS